MATSQKSGLNLGIGSFLEAGYEYEAGDRVTVEFEGEIYSAEVRAREASGPVVQTLFREGAPEYEVTLFEQEVEADANVQNDYDIEVNIEVNLEENVRHETVSEDDIL